jgi:hypothetical protein
MKNLTILSFFVLIFIFFTLTGLAQPFPQYPCADVPGSVLTTPSESGIYPFKIRSSSTSEVNLLNLFNQDTNDLQPIITSGQPYTFLEIDLGSDAFINGIQFWYPNGITNFSNFFVYFSNNSLGEESQAEIQENNEYHSMHIAAQYESGYYYEANHSARFITIINFTGDDIILNELKVKGKKEICGNGLDDDCDDKTDCEDEDCWVRDGDSEIILKKQPT